MSATKPLLRSLVPDQLDEALAAMGAEPYRAQQIRQWLFRHVVHEWDGMSNVPAALREDLASRYDLAGLQQVERQQSDDGTRKFLFKLRDGQTVESVIIPMEEHATFCISSQVGCGMACSFCATARGGKVRDLEAGEIIEQVLRLEQDLAAEPLVRGGRSFNVVFMGMGEPLDNWPAVHGAVSIFLSERGMGMSRRRVQISTSGPEPGLQALLESELAVGLTLSLGGSNDRDRKKLMPVPGRTSVSRVIELAAAYARRTKRRTTVAWVLIRDRSDQLAQSKELAALLAGKPMKVNLIPLNPVDDKLAPPAGDTVLDFQKILTDAGIDTFIRASGGRDIDAACGQLRRRRQQTE